MSQSYNGWPASPDKAAIGVASSEWFPGGAKAGDVVTVLRYVAEQFNARVEPIVGGWCWGYNYRANVNNPSSLSCHASGTAIDINAPEHPNGSGGTFTHAQRGAIYEILNEVQGAVDWLEGYDEMHFEIDVDAATLAHVAATLPSPRPTATPGVDLMFYMRNPRAPSEIWVTDGIVKRHCQTTEEIDLCTWMAGLQGVDNIPASIGPVDVQQRAFDGIPTA